MAQASANLGRIAPTGSFQPLGNRLPASSVLRGAYTERYAGLFLRVCVFSVGALLPFVSFSRTFTQDSIETSNFMGRIALSDLVTVLSLAAVVVSSRFRVSWQILLYGATLLV